MKQVIFSITLLVIISINACSQNNFANYDGKTWEQLNGSGRILKIYPTVQAFSKIELDNVNAKVLVQTGGQQYSITVSIDDNLKSFFICKQEDGILKLSMDFSGGKYDRWLSSSNITVNIKAPALVSLKTKGNGTIDINLQNQSSFSFVSNGNPDVVMNGKIGTLILQTTGNANIKADKLLAEKVTISSNGNCNITVNAKEVLQQSLKGNNDISNIFYGAKNNVKEQTKANTNTTALISIKIKNNGLLPAKVTLISYKPNENSNGTNGFVMGSYGSKSFQFPVGTKLYLASSQQVNTVMDGKTISNQVPFLVVKKEDEDKTFGIK